MEKPNWNIFAEKTQEQPPRPVLVKAVKYVRDKNEALDLGAGGLSDTRYLVEQGFKHVTAVDIYPMAEKESSEMPQNVVSYELNDFANFNFKKDTYDIINAQYSLPFTSPETFNRVFKSLIESMKIGGVFAGQLFGDRDDWNATYHGYTYHTKEQVEGLLTGLEVIQCAEEEYNGQTVKGEPKHWHVFHIIAIKK